MSETLRSQAARLTAEAARLREINADLIDQCEMYAAILRDMPPPKARGWNWPYLFKEVAEVLAKAKDRESNP